MEKQHIISNSALEEFSFDLRNTLSCAMGIINLLQVDEKLTHEGQHYLELLKDSFDDLFKRIECYTLNSKIVNDSNYDIPDIYINELKFKNARILLVDDYEVNNYIMKQLFNKFDITVDIAYSGNEAIKLYNKHDYDIIFMDYIMPEMNGLETVEHIRDIGEKGKNQLIIALSANVQDDTKDNFNKLGVELFIYKPVKLDQLCYILYKELQDKII